MEKEQVQKEFTRQANGMTNAPAFRSRTVLERMAALVAAGPGRRVLDLACGPGIVAEAVAPYASELVGVDLTPAMVRLAEQRFTDSGLTNGRFLVAPAEQLPFTDDSFAVVVTRLSLHHFSDVQQVLAEVRRVMAAQGTLIVADVISAEDPGAADLHNALEQLRDPSHVRMLSRTGLRSELENAGFTVQSEESWGQERSFGEWAQIVADPSRTAPLLQVMKTLARSGQQAGINLREVSNEVHFTHTWLLVKAMCRKG
jgi:ubiquinone/menaquinone biosynthesis C-methylase UbiE